MVTKTSKMASAIEIMTPAKARKILDSQNAGNRKIKEAVVRRLIAAIEAGHWIITHQGIAFGENGRLLDGQHRLTAIARADKPVKVMVTRGLSDNAFRVIDTGSARSPGDHFHLLGYKDANVLASALKMQWIHDQWDGDMSKRLLPENSPDKQDLEELAAAHPSLVRIVQEEAGAGANKAQSERLVTRSFWIWAYYHITTAHPVLGAEFMDALLTGANLSSDSIVLHLRSRLIHLSGEVAMKRRPSTHVATEKLALIIKTFNHVLAGKERGSKCVSWSRLRGEEFPRLAG